jgi:NAD(P)-dependent dehydrogenase (short-subunit alcohol dehydrogenase family)
MDDFTGRTAVVTGAAQGIGFGIARALAAAGANVVVADIQTDGAERAAAELATLGVRTLGIGLDVSDRAAVSAAAEQVRDALGNVHVLVNNAGVGIPPIPVSEIAESDWAWMIGVNLFGPINGVAAFLPAMRAHGEGGYIVNTASIGGLQVSTQFSPGAYSATKFAVVAFSEALAQELAGSPITVSVLCPGAVRTAIYHAARHRPARFGGSAETVVNASNDDVLADGMHPDEVGRRLLAAMREREFFVVTHPATRALIERRHDRIMAGYDFMDRYVE